MVAKTRIVVRTNVDWRTMDRETFARQDDPTRPLLFIAHAAQQDIVGVFERVFGVRYFDFRASIRDIASEGLRAVPDARITNGFEDFDAWFFSDEEEFLFPVDDDDIFNPALTAAVRELEPSTDVVIWNHAGVGYAADQRLPAVHRWTERVLFSNNWGIRKSFLRKLLPSDACRRFLACHRTAQSTLVRSYGIPEQSNQGDFNVFVDLDNPGVRHLDDALGLQLFHVGSLIGFWARSRVEDVERSFSEVDLTVPISLPGDLRWAEPFVARYSALMGDIAASRPLRLG
jgi:hypothetical protein